MVYGGIRHVQVILRAQNDAIVEAKGDIIFLEAHHFWYLFILGPFWFSGEYINVMILQVGAHQLEICNLPGCIRIRTRTHPMTCK